MALKGAILAEEVLAAGADPYKLDWHIKGVSSKPWPVSFVEILNIAKDTWVVITPTAMFKHVQGLQLIYGSPFIIKEWDPSNCDAYVANWDDMLTVVYPYDVNRLTRRQRRI